MYVKVFVKYSSSIRQVYVKKRILLVFLWITFSIIVLLCWWWKMCYD